MPPLCCWSKSSPSERRPIGRELAFEHADNDIFERLTHYAEELDQRARDFEQRIIELSRTVAKTHRLTAELRAIGVLPRR